MTDVWAKPIRAHSEEYPVALSQPGERPLLHILEDENDVSRIDQGLACPHCLAVFPARPELRNLAHFRGLNWGPDWMRDSALARVARGLCPHCGGEISNEMRALTDWGGHSVDRDPGEGNQ